MESEWRAKTGIVSLLRRAVSTLLLARGINQRVKALERDLEEEGSEVDEEEREERWERVHRTNAQKAYRHILEHKGFLAKVGQGLSARDGGIPQPYREEFRPLQDHLPVSNFDAVRRTVKAGLGRKVEELFTDFAQRPLASATVGQAHVAHLKSTGQKVCVKVQHHGVERLMDVDFRCVEYIARKALKKRKDVPDFTPIIREWRRASRDEVDFTLEAGSARRAGKALRAHGVDVNCPMPIDGLCSRHVMTMEFIEGWKITEVDRLPAGTDVAALGTQILEAFAVLLFKEGLIHGDPHPANIFVEPTGDGHVRPVLLDWGIVRELTPEERLHCARYIIACMSQDRLMFMSSLRALGYNFSEQFEAVALEQWMIASVFAFRDSLPGSSQAYLFEMLDQQGQEARKAEDLKKEEDEKKRKEIEQKQRPWFSSIRPRKRKKREPKKLVDSIPGIVLFFTRAISMLQGLCSTLNITISFAEPFRRHALSLLAGANGPASPLVVSLSEDKSDVERLVLATLAELRDNRSVVGAQVAVLRDEDVASGTWMCNVAFGVQGLCSGPITDGTLMPLLNVGVGALVTCLLAALARPTSTGKRVGLDTPLGQLWPEFAQHGKKGVTVRQLLQHDACMSRPFPGKRTGVKRFCNEKKMEESVASAPQEQGSDHATCPLFQGIAISALLRRMTGHATAADAIRVILEPLGLDEDIAFTGDEGRMAWVVREPIAGLGLDKIFEHMEREKHKLDTSEKDLPEWLSWKELEANQPACVDPLLPNRPEIRGGQACAPGRGLRASAKALCRLYASDVIPPELLRQGTVPRKRLHVESLEEWEEAGRCLDIGLGWQLMRFRRLESDGVSKEVIGYGYLDGATGSVSMRLPGASIAVLLNGVTALDQDANGHVGFELLKKVSAHLGLAPISHLDVPTVPAKLRVEPAKPKADEKQELRMAISRLEDRLQLLAQDVQGVLKGNGGRALEEDLQEARGSELAGTWRSAETEGIEALLRAFKVPDAFHFMVKKAERTLCIQVHSGKVSVSTSTSLAGRALEETTVSFEVGRPFQGEQRLGGSFRGVARWEPAEGADDASENGEAAGALLLEKRFSVEGSEIVLEERFERLAGERLMVTTTCHGLGEAGLAEAEGPLRSTTAFNRSGPGPAQSRVKPKLFQGSGGPAADLQLSGFRSPGISLASIGDALKGCMPICAGPCTGAAGYEDLDELVVGGVGGGARQAPPPPRPSSGGGAHHRLVHEKSVDAVK